VQSVTKGCRAVSLVSRETARETTEIISETDSDTAEIVSETGTVNQADIGHLSDAGGDAGLVTDKESVHS